MGNSLSVDGCAPIHTFTSSKAWIEGNAVHQLEAVAKLNDVIAVAGMPDLHPGKYGPVGCAMLANTIHPALVGADIGCGMGLYKLDMTARKIRPDKAAEKLRVLGAPWEGDTAGLISDSNLPATAFDTSLGTIGGGNHFCELQAIEEIIDGDVAARAGLDREAAFVLVHSGSRGLGNSILERVLAGGGVALGPSTNDGQGYLADHDRAVRWAKLNRRVIATRAALALRAEAMLINDLSHNLAEVTDRGILHRKGAAPSDRGLVPVPGSRDSLSYLVEPLAAMQPETLASIAHGAGRKYDRGAMHARAGKKKSDIEQLTRNRFGGVVVCEDRAMLIEEAPDAYKSIERVIDDLIAFGLARVVATFRPLVTFKSIKSGEATRKARQRDKGFIDKRRREDWR
jgi:release factor H-coupled RctB family protein